MGNCLVTKLKGVVDNPNLLPLGAFKLKFNSQANGGISIAYGVRSEATKVTFDKPVTIDGTVGTELTIQGSDISYHSIGLDEGEYTMVVGDKYSLIAVNLATDEIVVKEMIGFEYLESIFSLDLNYGGDDEVDLSNINHTSGPFSGINLVCANNAFKFTGDFPRQFVEHKANTAMTLLFGFTSTKDISDMRLSPFGWLELCGKMTMDVPAVVNGVSGNYLLLDASPNYYGDLSDARLENIKHFRGTGGAAFEWKGTRTNYIELERVKFKTSQDVDNMLINQAAIVATKPGWYNMLTIGGAQRTSASDAAVATLEAAGVGVFFE